jgi:hypothetical protein
VVRSSLSEDDALPLLASFRELGARTNLQNEKGDSPLHLALVHNEYRVAVALIDGKGDVNLKNRAGQTPLDLGAQDRSFIAFAQSRDDLPACGMLVETPSGGGSRLVLRNDSDTIVYLTVRGATTADTTGMRFKSVEVGLLPGRNSVLLVTDKKDVGRRWQSLACSIRVVPGVHYEWTFVDSPR